MKRELVKVTDADTAAQVEELLASGAGKGGGEMKGVDLDKIIAAGRERVLMARRRKCVKDVLSLLEARYSQTPEVDAWNEFVIYVPGIDWAMHIRYEDDRWLLGGRSPSGDIFVNRDVPDQPDAESVAEEIAKHVDEVKSWVMMLAA